MTKTLDLPTRSKTPSEPRDSDPQQTRSLRIARTRGLSDRQAVIAVMTTNGGTCQDIASELFLPLRTVQNHLYQALRILSLSRVEDLTFDVIEARHARTLQTATGRSVQPGTADPVPTDQSLNSLVALDEAEASHAHQEDVARIAALTLELATARAELEQQTSTVRQLHHAVDSRDTIGQAKGLLMERHKINAEAAFAALAGESNRSNRKLVDVAEHLIYSGEQNVR